MSVPRTLTLQRDILCNNFKLQTTGTPQHSFKNHFLFSSYVMAIPMPKKLSDLCTPSYIYFIMSVISLSFIAYQNVSSDKYCIGPYSCDTSSKIILFVMKTSYVLFWTWLLHIICKAGYNRVSWTLVLFPFLMVLLMLIVSSKVLYI